jgi:hypothetical protein
MAKRGIAKKEEVREDLSMQAWLQVHGAHVASSVPGCAHHPPCVTFKFKQILAFFHPSSAGINEATVT